MKPFLLLELDAPLMSFGGVKTGADVRTSVFPTHSQVVGLLGCALGYRRTDAESLKELSDGLEIGSVALRAGRVLGEYQTTRINEDERGWTRWGPEGRKVSPVYEPDSRELRRTGQVVRSRLIVANRELLADARFIVAVGQRGSTRTDLATLEEAIERPAWPLYFGQRACPPASPLRLGVVEARSMAGALWEGVASKGYQPAGLLMNLPASAGTNGLEVFDLFDYVAGVHTGGRFVKVSRLT